MVTLVIDNKTVCVPEGTSILDAARTASIDIPTLCYLKDLNEIGACRICMVEIEGQDTLVAACDNEVHEGMPLHQEHLDDVCPICGKPAKKMIYWGVAY